MSLCFTEVIVFASLAIISSFIGEKVFIIIFILSILSSILININIKNSTYTGKQENWTQKLSYLDTEAPDSVTIKKI